MLKQSPATLRYTGSRLKKQHAMKTGAAANLQGFKNHTPLPGDGRMSRGRRPHSLTKTFLEQSKKFLYSGIFLSFFDQDSTSLHAPPTNTASTPFASRVDDMEAASSLIVIFPHFFLFKGVHLFFPAGFCVCNKDQYPCGGAFPSPLKADS